MGNLIAKELILAEEIKKIETSNSIDFDLQIKSFKEFQYSNGFIPSMYTFSLLDFQN